MDVGRTAHGNTAYNVLVVVLIAAIATCAGLLLLTTGAPRAAALELSAPEAEDCPFGSGSPVCYRFDLANTGGNETYVRCEALPAGDTTAVFANGGLAYESALPLEAGDVFRLYVRVDPGPSDVVQEPSVTCLPSP